MKQGFTLVELIVVITILAILGSIASISYKGYGEESWQSKQDKCVIQNFDAIRKDSVECREVFAPYKCEDMIFKKYKCDFNSINERNDNNN